MIGYFQTFELSLRQKKKDKSIALKSTQEENIDIDEDDEDVALLTKNFNKFFKKMGKQSKLAPNAIKPPKGKNPFKSNIYASKNKCAQCKECDDFGHIQFKYAIHIVSL